MKFGVVVFPGSNCDHDTTYLLSQTLGQEVAELWHKDHDLQNCDFIMLPGGFSFGDYLRSGDLARFSTIIREVFEFRSEERRVGKECVIQGCPWGSREI